MKGQSIPEEASSSSPTSIVTVPLTPPSNVVQSRILSNTLSSAEQQGTEVALLNTMEVLPFRRCFADEIEEVDDDEDEEEDDDDLSFMTPLPKPVGENHAVPTSPLGKSAQQYSSPATPLKVHMCGVVAPFWKSSERTSDDSTCRGGAEGVSSEMPVQDYILALLGNRDTTGSWHGHFACFSKSVAEEIDPEIKRQHRQLLKRRPHQIKAQRSHLDDLRRNLYPFGASPRRVNLGRTWSHRHKSKSAVKPRKPLQAMPTSDNLKSSVWNAALGCHNPEIVPVDSFDASFEGYDSDPECFGRTPSVRSPNRQQQTPRRLFVLDIEGDESKMREMTASTLNERWTLILHRPEKRPQAFHVWIERGQRLQTTVVSPKFTWKALPKKDEHKNMESAPTSSFDILDVQRILPLNEIDRSQYPLAKAGNCILLKTVNAVFCWQAASAQERDRLILLWKMSVARFGSMLVTGDSDGMEDYFAPLDALIRLPGIK
jgi:hypothetical protein